MRYSYYSKINFINSPIFDIVKLFGKMFFSISEKSDVSYLSWKTNFFKPFGKTLFLIVSVFEPKNSVFKKFDGL